MKKIMSATITVLFTIIAQAQDASFAFIDSLADKTNPYKTILLFAEIRDTTDDQTGKLFTQRSSYYYDWVRKELRYIEVYNFDGVLKRNVVKRAFRKQKCIPPATYVKYTFFENKLLKVKLVPSKRECEQCVEEYYLVNDVVISNNKINISGEKRDFIKESNYYFARF